MNIIFPAVGKSGDDGMLSEVVQKNVNLKVKKHYMQSLVKKHYMQSLVKKHYMQSLDKQSLDKQSLDIQSLDKKSLDIQLLDIQSLDKKSLDIQLLDKISKPSVLAYLHTLYKQIFNEDYSNKN
jgi:hypothetical protein